MAATDTFDETYWQQAGIGGPSNGSWDDSGTIGDLNFDIASELPDLGDWLNEDYFVEGDAVTSHAPPNSAPTTRAAGPDLQRQTPQFLLTKIADLEMRMQSVQRQSVVPPVVLTYVLTPPQTSRD